MPFQTVMNAQPAIGIEGDWASANPRFTQLTGPAPIIAGPNGVTVGRFAWVNGNLVSNQFFGGCLGFVHRDQPSLIVPQGFSNWLPSSTMVVPPGLEVSLFDECDVLVRFAAGATPGQTVYVNYADGTAVAAAASSATTITASSFAIVATTSMSVTASIANGIMTVTAVGGGAVYPGSIISGTGVITGTQVLAQITPLLTGEATGGIGRYMLNYDNGVVVASETITGSIGILTITTTAATTWNIGDTLSGTGVTAGTQITANVTNGTGLTGNGGTGTYAVSPSQTASTGTLTGATNIASKWLVDTYAGNGELAKISQRS